MSDLPVQRTINPQPLFILGCLFTLVIIIAAIGLWRLSAMQQPISTPEDVQQILPVFSPVATPQPASSSAVVQKTASGSARPTTRPR